MAKFIVKVRDVEVESQPYSRFDSFDPSGWLDEDELDIFAIIHSLVKG